MSEANPYQSLLEQLQACDNQDDRERLLMRFTLDGLPENMRAAVQAAAVPRFFDLAFLNALLEQPIDEAEYTELTSYSYVEPYPGPGLFNIHERTRKLLQEKLWQKNPALYCQFSARALKYCAAQDQNDTTWRIETVYHQLIAKPDNGADALNNTCVQWMNPPHFAFSKTESLLYTVREHLEMNRLTKRAENFFLLNQTRVDMHYSRFQEAKEALQKISLSVGEDECYLMVRCLEFLGDVHLHLSELSEARRCYEEALHLYREIGNRNGKANCLLSLGEVHLYLSEFPEARLRYEEALPLYKEVNSRLGEANCFYFLGDVYFCLSELIEARRCYEEALLLYKETSSRLGTANCLYFLGDVHFRLYEFIEARRCYEEALHLYHDISSWSGEINCLKSLNQVYLCLHDATPGDMFLAGRGQLPKFFW
jgi:tetratricopeptide (TPR) repeat protein